MSQLLAFLREQQQEERKARQESNDKTALLFEEQRVAQTVLNDKMTALDTERKQLAEAAAIAAAIQKEQNETAKAELDKQRQAMQDAFDKRQADLLANHAELAKTQQDILTATAAVGGKPGGGSSSITLEKNEVGQFNSVLFPTFDIPATMVLSPDVTWDERDSAHASDPTRLALAWRIVHSKLRDFFHELAPLWARKCAGAFNNVKVKSLPATDPTTAECLFCVLTSVRWTQCKSNSFVPARTRCSRRSRKS